MVRRRQVLTVGGLTFGGLITTAGYAIARRRDALAGTPSVLRIATGPPGGVLRGMGAALAAVLRRRLPGTQVWLIPTDASLDNLALLRRGEADLGFAALDATAGFPTSEPTTAATPATSGLAAGQPELSATARLFDSWMQVLVRAESPVTQFRQLDGRPIAAGALGSGTRFGLRRLVTSLGVTPILVDASQDEGAAALAAGAVDAFVTFSGVPTPAVVGLLRTTGVRMLPLAGEAAIMNRRFADVYTAATLPATAYRGLGGIPTFTTPNLLLVRPALAASLVHAITAALFDDRASITRDHPEANQINIRTGVQTTPVRLHPGAAEYFRTVKL